MSTPIANSPLGSKYNLPSDVPPEKPPRKRAAEAVVQNQLRQTPTETPVPSPRMRVHQVRTEWMKREMEGKNPPTAAPRRGATLIAPEIKEGMVKERIEQLRQQLRFDTSDHPYTEDLHNAVNQLQQGLNPGAPVTEKEKTKVLSRFKEAVSKINGIPPRLKTYVQGIVDELKTPSEPEFEAEGGGDVSSTQTRSSKFERVKEGLQSAKEAIQGVPSKVGEKIHGMRSQSTKEASPLMLKNQVWSSLNKIEREIANELKKGSNKDGVYERMSALCKEIQQLQEGSELYSSEHNVNAAGELQMLINRHGSSSIKKEMKTLLSALNKLNGPESESTNGPEAIGSSSPSRFERVKEGLKSATGALREVVSKLDAKIHGIGFTSSATLIEKELQGAMQEIDKAISSDEQNSTLNAMRSFAISEGYSSDHVREQLNQLQKLVDQEGGSPALQQALDAYKEILDRLDQNQVPINETGSSTKKPSAFERVKKGLQSAKGAVQGAASKLGKKIQAIRSDSRPSVYAQLSAISHAETELWEALTNLSTLLGPEQMPTFEKMILAASIEREGGFANPAFLTALDELLGLLPPNRDKALENAISSLSNKFTGLLNLYRALEQINAEVSELNEEVDDDDLSDTSSLLGEAITGESTTSRLDEAEKKLASGVKGLPARFKAKGQALLDKIHALLGRAPANNPEGTSRTTWYTTQGASQEDTPREPGGEEDTTNKT